MQKKYIRLIIYLFLITLAIFLSIVPDIYRLRITPADTAFPLLHNHPEDYFSYLSYMYTGFEGKWLVTSRVTSEHFAPQFIYTFYIILGHLSRITRISLVFMYFLVRIILAFLLLVTVLYIIRKLFQEFRYRLLALYLVLFGTGFWSLNYQSGKFTVTQFLTFWTHFDPVMRTTFLPHHMISTIFGLLSIIFLAESLKFKSLKIAIFAGLLGFLSGLNYHGTMTNILGGLSLISLPILFLFHKKPHLLSRIIIFTAFTVLSGLSLVYILYLTHTVWPWTASQNLGRQFSFFVSMKEYILGLGPAFILTLVGLPFIFRCASILPIILLGWTVFPFIGLFMLINIFPQFSNMIYLEATSYIPLGILAVYGIQNLEKRAGKLKIFPVIFFLLILYSIPPIYSSVMNQLNQFTPYYYNQFIPNDVISAFKWLEKNSPSGSVVLAGGFMGAIIPAYSHNYMVFGDPVGTYDAGKKSADMDTFFKQADDKAASQILRKYNVSYIFCAQDTDSPKESFISLLPLEKVFENSKVTIYKVNK